MSVLSIALQGVGYAPLVLALQGFTEVASVQPPSVPGHYARPTYLPVPQDAQDDEQAVLMVIAAFLQMLEDQ